MDNDSIENNYYVWLDESFSRLSDLKDLHKAGFKFILSRGSDFLYNWFKENEIPLQDSRYSYDKDYVAYARIMNGEDSYGLRIIMPSNLPVAFQSP